MAIPDPVNALVSYLRADSDLAGLVTTAVFGGELPDAPFLSSQHSLTMPDECVVLTPSGGFALGPGARSYQELVMFRLDLKAFGATPTLARTVFWAAHSALKQMRRNYQGTAKLFSATVSGGPQQLRDPDTDWPYILGSYDILAAEAAAS